MHPKPLLITVLILAASAYGQQSSRVTLTPAKPRVGGTVSVVYAVSTAPEPLQKADAVTLDVFTVTSDHFPDGYLREIPMTKEGKTWKCSVPVKDPASKLLIFRFVAGDAVDDDNDNVWSVMVYDARGRAVRNAHFSESLLYNYGVASFKRKQNPELAKKEIAAELALYPDNWDVRSFQWATLTARGMSDSMRTAIRVQLDKFSAKDRNNDSLLARYPLWYERVGDTAKANELRAFGISRVPNGWVALDARLEQVRSFRDPAERLRLLQQTMTEYPPKDSSSRQERYMTLAYTAMQAKQIDVAAEALAHVAEPSPYMYLNLAGAQAKTGDHLDLAESLARRAVELSSLPSANPRKQFKTEKEWTSAQDDLRGSALAELADVLVKEGKMEDGFSAYQQAYTVSRAEDAELDGQYVDALLKGKAYRKALDVAMEVVAKGKGTDALLESARSAFAASEGVASFDSLSADRKKTFDSMVAEAHEKGVAAVRQGVLKNRISQPGIDFTLKDLDGKPVHLAALRGKVVVVDFWATWCGPCKMSFPFLQKVFQKYQDNPSVAILAVDCWERQKDWGATAENAKKFHDANKYTWPILVDDRDEVVTAYGVDGIPTKFILDRNGRIAFKSVGYSGPDMEEELTQQIEVLLAETARNPD